jgi:alkyl sulfatase BDS1-like metallo-beta-lactamase superfamily hydrolase
MFTKPSTNLTEVGSLDSTTKPRKTALMTQVLAVKIDGGKIKDVRVTGIFKIAETDKPFSVRKGRLRVCVECLWKGSKTKETSMQITLGKNWKIFQNYSGEIIIDVS